MHFYPNLVSEPPSLLFPVRGSEKSAPEIEKQQIN
jgi:hypothetical protein